MPFILTMACLAAANLISYHAGFVDQDVAYDRTWFQGVAIFCVWLNCKIEKLGQK